MVCLGWSLTFAWLEPYLCLVGALLAWLEPSLTFAWLEPYLPGWSPTWPLLGWSLTRPLLGWSPTWPLLGWSPTWPLLGWSLTLVGALPWLEPWVEAYWSLTLVGALPTLVVGALPWLEPWVEAYWSLTLVGALPTLVVGALPWLEPYKDFVEAACLARIGALPWLEPCLSCRGLWLGGAYIALWWPIRLSTLGTYLPFCLQRFWEIKNGSTSIREAKQQRQERQEDYTSRGVSWEFDGCTYWLPEWGQKQEHVLLVEALFQCEVEGGTLWEGIGPGSTYV